MKSVKWKTNSMAAKLQNSEAVLKGNLPATSALKSLGTAGFKGS